MTYRNFSARYCLAFLIPLETGDARLSVEKVEPKVLDRSVEFDSEGRRSPLLSSLSGLLVLAHLGRDWPHARPDRFRRVVTRA
jgi:hypothetical protein